MDRRRFGEEGSGAFGKLLFMKGSVPALDELTFTSNERLTKLVEGLMKVLSERYRDGRHKTRMPSFVSKYEYNAFEPNHDTIINLFDQALESDGWPENDRAPTPVTMPSISSMADLRANSKRSWDHVSTDGTSTSSVKRRKPSPLM